MWRIFGSALTALLVGLFVWAAIEQTYRIYLFGWAAFSYARVNSVQPLGDSGLFRASESHEIVYELKPNLNTYFKLAPLRTNSVGLHDEEYSAQKPPNTRRVALIGSSFSMPSGAALEDSWHYLVEQRLDAAEPSRRHEIINFAVGGYGARQILAVLKRNAFSYQPELILFELTTHLPHISYPDEFYERAYTVRPATSSFWQSFAWERASSGFASPRRKSLAHPGERLVELETVLKQARDVSNSHGVRLCFVILNINTANERKARILGQLASRQSSCVIDTTGAFRNMKIQDLVIYPVDQHPNAKAHAIFADVIAPRIAVELDEPFR